MSHSLACCIDEIVEVITLFANSTKNVGFTLQGISAAISTEPSSSPIVSKSIILSSVSVKFIRSAKVQRNYESRKSFKGKSYNMELCFTASLSSSLPCSRSASGREQ